MSTSPAQQLASLIAQAVKDIEMDTATQLNGATSTDLNLPTVAPEDGLEATPLRRAAIRTLKAATHQLLATLMPVGLHVQELHYSYLQTAAIDIVVQARIADLIYSIDPDSQKGGVQIDLLAEKAGMEARKLSHVLRFLALRNIFCEPSLNHWANNRCSFPLRTDSPNSLHNYLMQTREHIALPALVKLPEVLLDKEGGAAFSWERSQSAFQKYYNPGCDFFEFLAKEENGYQAERFGKAMLETTKATGAGFAHYKGFDWQKLGPTGTLIDVGGGIGGAAYAICSYLPGWKVVIQDRSEVIKDGKENYQKIGSNAQLEFEEADFLKEQPQHRIKTVDAYFLRHVLHDWPAKSCVEILTHLRRAAKPTTRLLICETGLEPPLLNPSSPILSNGGMAAAFSYNLNLNMLTIFNAEERSKEEFEILFKTSGWELVQMTPLNTILYRFIFEGVPDPTWSEC